MDEIKEKIIMYLTNEKIGIDDSKLSKNFFSTHLGMSPFQLVYLVEMLEEEFSFHFLEEDFDSLDFYNVKGLCEIIKLRLVNR